MGWKNREEREGKGWEALNVSLLSPRDFFTLSPNRQRDSLITGYPLTHCSNLCYYIPQKYGVRMTNGILINGSRTLWKDYTVNFINHFLGLNKRASNVVAWNDKPTIYLNILKFRQHLEELPENSIAEQCLIISKELAIPSSVYQICSQFCKEGKNTTGLDDIQQINKLEISKLTKKYS